MKKIGPKEAQRRLLARTRTARETPAEAQVQNQFEIIIESPADELARIREAQRRRQKAYRERLKSKKAQETTP